MGRRQAGDGRAKGKKDQECTVCGEKGKTEEIAAPEIIDGKGQTMVVDAAKDLSFRSNAPLEFFQKVLVDDKEVAAENYVLTEGSTIVTLKASFLKTLGVGEHKLSVVSSTGTAETTFTVAELPSPLLARPLRLLRPRLRLPSLRRRLARRRCLSPATARMSWLVPYSQPV